jgi:hypothetical protein
MNERESMIDFLRHLGVTEELLHRMTNRQLIDLTLAKTSEAMEAIKTEEEKLYIGNMESKIPELKRFLSHPIEVYVKKIGKKRTPAIVKVIGFNPLAEELIICHKEKIIAVPKENQINTPDELRICKENNQKHD